MDNKDLLSTVKAKAEEWMQGSFDSDTRAQVKELYDHNEKELVESFYRDLEFGTGGLRGLMGVGTNRMNRYTVGMATQGLCNYMLKEFSSLEQIKVAIAHDSRNNSRLFAETSAKIFAANNIKVYLFDSLRPTPELSFAIRHFGCQGGIVITASHNPKEYNGYKVYWDDGGQIIAPHDKQIIQEVQQIKEIEEVKFEGAQAEIQAVGNEVDEIYTDKIKSLSLSSEMISRNHDMKIVYTPIHGSGVDLVPMALKKLGFTNIHTIEEQNASDGNFPTVKSPNPEEPAALAMALDKAKEIDADIVMGTDPDADRVGIAVKNPAGELVLLNGNQTGVLLINYLISQWQANNKLSGNEYIVKTIVTTEMLSQIADEYKIRVYDVLTGFKYIADIMKRNDGSKTFIAGAEESYGYLAGDFVRDKDAVMSCALIAETAAWARDQGKTLYNILIDLYIKYGYYKESLMSITRQGKEGAEEIRSMMENFRNTPPESINNSDVMLIHDYQKQQTVDMVSQLRYDINLPPSNVLQFVLKDGSKISVRPSGTEPKIKFYFGVIGDLKNKKDFERVSNELDERIENIKKSLKII
ncbi:MAG TPA: phospho-sugar mutase [Bacteroidales bacterium]|nr:phospho-sugar mutase [Bacteroidales bacterium]